MKRRSSGQAVLVVLGGFISCLLAATYLLSYPEAPAHPELVAAVNPPTSAQPSQPPVPPSRIHAVEKLRSKVLEISEARAGTEGVVVFDPYSGETLALNADRRFIAASLSKMSVLLTLYRAADRGEVNLEDKITMHPSDVWAFGTGVLYTYPVGYTMTLRKCATFMIKESDNTAELMLNRYLGKDKIEAELHRIGADSTSYWHPTNMTTPHDVMLVLKAIADPSYTSPELSSDMLGLMTHTSFENRLSGPLPEGTRVAHKIGSYESTFSDAGIVFPDELGSADQRYYIVVFCEGATEGEARGTIQDISLAAYRALSSSDAG